LTGNAKPIRKTPPGWWTWLWQRQRRYLVVDGGSGAHLVAALAEHPRLQRVFSPRHADLLIVIEPVSQKLAPAVAEVARAMPRPAEVLVVGEPGPARFPVADFVSVEEVVPSARRITDASVEQVCIAALDAASWTEHAVVNGPALEPTMIPLPAKREREIATELAVLSLGPIQPFSAGPLRVLLVCDGEQVLSAHVEAGYAHRNIVQTMLKTGWRAALDVASHLDPLAPIASQLAYVRVLEQLQGWQPPSSVTQLREAALAIERAQNQLWWLVRFAELLAAPALAARAHALAIALAECSKQLWQCPTRAWIAPQSRSALPARDAVSALERLADKVDILRRRIEHDRLVALRTRGIGLLPAERVQATGVSGPVLLASEQGVSDVQSRLLMRLGAAVTDLRAAVKAMSNVEQDEERSARWEAPAGEAQAVVEGPRGRIGLHLVSEGGKRPSHVEWERPSAALLALVPEVLAGQKLVDAEVIMASLDLAMAEADG
jgi:NADH-quinone oxidoreductase subunit D